MKCPLSGLVEVFHSRSGDWWAGQTLSYFQIPFPVFLKYHSFGTYLFFFLSLNLFFGINIPQCPTQSSQHWQLPFWQLRQEGKGSSARHSWLSLSWQTLRRWVYLQAQHLSGPKLHIWNKNVVSNEVWLSLSEGQLCTWHEGRRGLPPSTQTSWDLGQQGAVS